MKNTLLFVLLFTITFSGISQISYKKRIELELKDGYYDEQIYEFGKNGFIMKSIKNIKEGNEREWKYELYNTDLKSVKSESVMLHKRQFADETFVSEEYIHTLYRGRKGSFSIVSVKASNLEIHKADGMIPKKSRISEMAVLGDYAYFRSTIKGSPYLFSVNWKTGQQKPIPLWIEGFRPKDIDLYDFQLLEKSSEIMLYTHVKINKKKSDVYVIQLDDKGNKIGDYNLTKGIEENIIDISAFNMGGGQYIFTGTYSTKSRFSSEGIFFSKAEGSNINHIEFHNYTNLDNFLSYLPEKKQKKLEKKKKKKEKKGKEFILNYKIAMHDIITLDDGYLMLGEAYYPTTRIETYTTTSTVNGATTTTTHTRQVFDGYQYTHGVITKFGLNGNLEWDQTFEMWPLYKPFTVKRFISIAEQNNNSFKMVFANRSTIVSKIIGHSGNVIQDNESDLIETEHTGDKTKRSFSNLDYWYNNYFIAYGQQKIKNKEDKNVKKKRKVYFISKVQFE
ncbi:MAG: hypothetical protein ABFS35_03060 [Bacteroidota bacterium]